MTVTPHRRRRAVLKPLALAIHLGCLSLTGLALPAFAEAESAMLGQVHQYAIAAGPLNAALNQFARDSGLYISGLGELTQGKQTAGLQGRYAAGEALQRLLAGSGLGYRLSGERAVVLQPRIQSGRDENNDLILAPVTIEASSETVFGDNGEGGMGVSVYNQKTIEAIPTGAGNLTDLLQINPAVDYSRSSSNSASSGSMRPDEISIHGQAFYQNAFIIDGIDTTSDLNPGSGGDTYSNPITPTNLSMLGGSSPQSYYVDLDALEMVKVHDSNISAAYGGFTGGVVEARLKRYSGEDSVAIKYGMQSDAWESFHVAAEDEEDFSNADSYDGSFTPDYRKQNFSLTALQGISDNLGATVTLSRRTSRFRQQYENAADEVRDIYYNDTIDNLMGRFDMAVNDRLDLGLSYRYANRFHDGLTSSTYDGTFEKAHQGYGLGAEMAYRFDQSKLQMQLAFDRAADTLKSDSATFAYHPSANYYDSPAYAGAYGDVNQQQDTYTFKVDWQRDAIQWGPTRHQLSAGSNLRYINAYYELPRDIESYIYSCISGSAASGCNDSNGDGVHDSSDEYLRTYAVNEANQLSKEYGQLSLYVQDEISLGKWQLTAGLRADQETLLDNLDLSPRLALQWDAFGDKSTVLMAGASRYYGRSFLRYAINDTLRSWRTSTTYNSDGSVRSTSQTSDRSLQDYNLRTPYSDELALGITQQLGPVAATLKYVNRESRDGVQRTRDDDGLYYYTNEGRSSTDEITLEVSSRDALQLWGSQTRALLGIGWKQSESNAQSSEDSYDETYTDEQIYYHGNLIYSDQLPAWDYNIPFTVKFSTVTEIPGWHLTWSNFVNLRSGGTTAVDSGEDYTGSDGGSYDIYEDRNFDDLITLDTRFQWRPPLFSKYQGYVQLEVNNLLDDVVDTSTSSSSTSYTAGRRASVEVGLRF